MSVHVCGVTRYHLDGRDIAKVVLKNRAVSVRGTSKPDTVARCAKCLVIPDTSRQTTLPATLPLYHIHLLD